MPVPTTWLAEADVTPDMWADAPPAGLLELYLGAAQERCEAYAPAPIPDPIPRGHILAQLADARDLWTAAQRSGSADLIGGDGYAVRVRPLSDYVRSLLRPPSPVPTFGTA